ncbi:alpha/beta-hydrolase [Gymnopilus junonius]|uniref:Carboxylic ester hydrolase n=1 Tax=Gymnopilus junonius TaxID=109634 RepID=A0A9P5NXH9_GYMJU|nr:alpha/beta-hydrolase [Gymnopilus junonius]
MMGTHTALLVKLSLLLCGVYCALGAPQSPASSASTTSAASSGRVNVKIKTGVFRGVTTADSVDKFLGIPFAEQPVGSLRFKAPVAVTQASNAVKDASQFGNACPQPSSTELGAPIGEDCLHLNIFRPTGISSNTKLPILFWIHGGAFTTNSASNPQFDPTEIIQRSVAIGKPIIFVSTNYRVNTFGFLASADVPAEDLNAGLQDQRMALTFVQDNIAAFGGNPEKVTIWGQSAGAGSVEAHFVFPSERKLFRAGIADSSTGPFKNSPDVTTFDKPGKPFSRLLAATGCSAGRNAVSCLQKVPFETLMNISNTMIDNTLNGQLWQPAVGPPGSFVPERASARIEAGNFLRLPFLGGTNINEGTTFSTTVKGLGLTGTAQTDAFINFIGHLVIDNSTLSSDVMNQFIKFFPANDPTLGAPFNTGDSLFDRAEAWYTDQMFLSPRRFWFQHASAVMPMFAYYFGEFIPGNDISLGVAHASELELFFGPIPPAAAVEIPFATQLRDFYINFITDLNPGPGWDAFTPASQRVLQLIRDNITMIPDEIDVQQVAFSNSAKVLNEFEK